MANRTRTRIEEISSGTHSRTNGSQLTTINLSNNRETISDVVAPGNGHSLAIDKYFYTGTMPLYNGEYSYTARAFRCTNFPPGRISTPDWDLQHLALGDSPTDAALAAKLVKDTNPSRPLVDLPVFIWELRDLPGLLLKRTNHIGRDIASGRLSLEYGWKPLINDLIKLLNFRKEFRSRVNEINRLRESGLRRKRKLWSGSAHSSPNYTLLNNNSGLVVYGSRAKITTQVASGFVKWRPNASIPRHLGLQNDLTEQKALFALLGLNPYVVDASTIWEAIPYSWLADWCTNVGDLLAANRNIVGAYPEDIQIMRLTISEETVDIDTNSASNRPIFKAVGGQPAKVVRYHVTKSRSPASLSLDVHYPLLSERQVMILADIVRNQLPGKIYG